MTEIIGQEKLISRLKKYNFSTLPKSILLLGEAGSGKRYISTKFAAYLQVELIELTNKTTYEDLIDYNQDVLPKLYFLSLKNIPEKQQQKFLKFIEESSNNIRIIIAAESEIGVLPTIMNRCIKYRLEDYTLEQLKQFKWAPQMDATYLSLFFNTPGQLLEATNIDKLDQLHAFCTKLVSDLKNVSYATFIGHSLNINYKDDYSKFNFDLFLKMLTKVVYNLYIKERTDFWFNLYLIINRKKKELLNKTVAKENFVLSLLDEMWRLK